MSEIITTLRGSTASPPPAARTAGRVRQWWLDRPVRGKALVAGALPLVVIAAVLVLVATLQARQSSLRADARLTRDRVELADDARARLDAAESALLRAAATGSAESRDAYDTASTLVPGAMDALADGVEDSLGERPGVDGPAAAALSALDDLRAALPATRPDPALLERATAAVADARGEVADWRERLEAQLADERAELDATSARALVVPVVGVALAMVLGLAGGLLTTRGVVSRVEALTRNVDRFVAGEPIVRMAPARDEIGRLTGTLDQVSVMLANRQADLTASRDEAVAATRAKDEFLSRMSHELRTPLTAIIGFGQLLQMEDLAADDRESVDHIVRAGHHLLDLINEVLDIAKIETGHLSVSVEPVTVADVVDEATALIRAQAVEREITLRLDVPADAVAVADRQRLKQVLLNLLSNAVKYNAHGGRVTLTCEAAPAGAPGAPSGGEAGHVRIAVSDTGMGIPAATMHRLFTPFDRLDAAHGPIEGTGVGLALSKGLVQAMGGTIGVRSRVAEGTTFWVDLPRAPEAPPEPPARPPAAVGRAPAAAPAGHGEARTGPPVLYVEDNLANLRLMERLFRDRPERLEVAMQGRRSVELARELQPRLVLLDLNLPDIDGDVALRMLKADPATAGIPVVIISADATPRRAEQLCTLGAAAYLAKPIDVPELLAVLDRY